MKRLKTILHLSSILGLVFLFWASFVTTAGAASEKPIKLTFSTVFPPVHLQSKLNRLYCDEITKKTNGRVEITHYPGSTLTSATKNFEGVAKGISDMGMSCPLYVAGRFPVSEIFEMPSELDSGWVTAKVYMDLFNKFKLKEYEQVHVLYLHGPSRNVVSTRSVPVRKLADMKGLLMRASGGAASTVAAFGAIPRAMHMGEAYAALSKGVVEGQFAPPESLKGWKHADVVKYTSITPVSTSSCQYVIMNKKKWDSLPADIQKIITEVSANYPVYHGHVWAYLDSEGFEYLKSLPGRELITISKDQLPEWQAAVKPVIENYIKEKTAMGLPAKEYLDYFNERVAYWSAKKPSLEESAAWVKANLLND